MISELKYESITLKKNYAVIKWVNKEMTNYNKSQTNIKTVNCVC